jgi:hypothetical protein
MQFVVNQAPSCDLLMVKIQIKQIQQESRCSPSRHPTALEVHP